MASHVGGSYNGDGSITVADLSILNSGFGDSNGAACVVAAPETLPARPLVLSAPRPNPARGALVFPLTLERATSISLDVFDVGGRLVAAVAAGRAEAGPQLLEWNPQDEGVELATGSYFVRLTTEYGVETRRFAFVR